MLPHDIEREIEKLKLKRIELTNKLNLATDFDEKEKLEKEIEIIQKQIETLEKFK